MSYVKQNFQDGQVLNAAHLNHMEDALYQHDENLTELLAFMSAHGTVQTGSVTLTNTQEFPFNNSHRAVALATAQENTDYIVVVEVEDFTGNVGEIAVTDKMINGFALEYNGSAPSVDVNYFVIGGFEE